MDLYIYWILITVFFAAFLVFFIKWILLRKQLKKQNVEEEIISMVDEGFEQGVLEDSEAEMIHNIFEFGDKQTQDIMTNRSNIAAIDAESTLADAKDMMMKLPYSRYPVFINDLDHIIGIIHLKDIVRYTDEEHDGQEIIKNCKTLLRKAVFIPETKDVDDLFRRMQAERIQMAIVVDEYGQTSGLIAMEDILEEIVGNIMDEYDVKDFSITETGKDSYELDGLVPLEEVEEALGIKFETEEYETLNGFMISNLEHIPTADDIGFSFVSNGFTFEILSVENHIIGKALVKRTEKTDEQVNVEE
ncbi:MAG: HlyC/CorC family transporter [Lachnospiraceae bacterium]|nr:HlyC/CorC family transporter [Lachnospiraceae bacterium]